MDRGELVAAIHQMEDDALEVLETLLPVLSEMRLGGRLSTKTFGEYHKAGLAATLVVSSRPGRRERERVEASLVTGTTVQLALDFDAMRTTA